jgi:hypothetical protein
LAKRDYQVQRIMEYLIGTVDDPRNWGNRSTTRGGVWAALEKVVAPAYRNQFIFMQRLVTDDLVEISMYLHEATGTMILIDDDGQSYEWLGNGMGFVLISMQEAHTRLMSALLDAIDDEMEQGIPLHEVNISHYRFVSKRMPLMLGIGRPKKNQQRR